MSHDGDGGRRTGTEPTDASAFDPAVVGEFGAEAFLRAVVSTVADAVLVVDREGRIAFANPAVESLLDYEPAELVGEPLSSLVPERFRDQFDGIGDRWTGGVGIEQALSRRDGTEFPGLLTFGRGGLAGGDLFVVLVRDVGGLRERERALEEEQAFTESVLHTIPDVFYAFDADGTMLRWNDELTARTGYTDAEIAEMHPLDVVPEGDRAEIGEAISNVFARGAVESRKSALVTKDGREIPHEFSGSRIVDDEGNVLGLSGIARDVSEREERERAIAETEEKYRRLVETAPDAIFVADAETGIIRDVNTAAEELTGRSREELTGMHQTELHPPADAERYRRLFTEHGERGGFFDESKGIYVRRADGRDVPVEINAAITEIDDARVIQAVFRDITERRRHEEELARQRDELETLNRINTVIRTINRGLVGATTRSEIEQLVCDRLAAADPYGFAWIGTVNPGAETVAPRTWAGIDADEIAGTGIALDAADPTVRGPTATAVRERRVVVTGDVPDGLAAAPWHDRARERGYRSAAAIPLPYEGSLYGVLAVYAERAEAFDERERAVLGELGEAIAHAMNALERKEGLMTDSVVELELRIEDVTDALGETSAEASGQVSFDRTIPAGDEAYLQYVTVRDISEEQMRAFVANSPNAESLKRIGTRGDETLYEIRYEDPAFISTLATYGGRVRHAFIEDGEFRMLVDLPDKADIRMVMDRIRGLSTDVEFVAQRRRARGGPTPQEYGTTVEDRLTEKQRSALEAAYFAGYFDRPRTSSGADVAGSLGVTASTFHQHLQVGLRKLLSAAFEADGSDADT